MSGTRFVRRNSLLRSTPFRLALAFSCMMIVAFAVTGVVVHRLIANELQRHQDDSIQETYAVIASAYGDSDIVDMRETLATYVKATRRLDRIFLLADGTGRVLGGNLPSLDVPPGWSTTVGAGIGAEPDLSYRVFAGEVDGYRLVVGSSQQEVDTLQSILGSGLAWAAVLVSIFAVGGGNLLARRARTRFDAVSDTMHAVARGTLSARIPTTGRGDDIDLLAGEINAALARLESTVEGMRQVSADIAHDLKTPLNRLRMTIDEMLDRQRKGQPMDGELAEAAEEADRINETFDALLRVSQIEAGSRRSRFAPVDLGAIVDSVVEIYSDVAEDEGDVLRLEVEPGGSFETFGDRELLTQMLANLIENAIRHCPAGTTITVRLQAGDRVATLSVQDDGPGIPTAEHTNVFRRLYRIEKSRTTPGSGLGLSLVKAVADLHGAGISLFDMRPGLRVAISFPRSHSGS